MSEEVELKVEEQLSKTKTELNPATISYIVGDNLSFWGTVFLWLGAIIAIGCVVASGFVTKRYSVDGWGENGISWSLIVSGGGIFIQAFIVKLFLDGFSEIIKVLVRK